MPKNDKNKGVTDGDRNLKHPSHNRSCKNIKQIVQQVALSKLNGTEYTNTKMIPNSLPGVSLHILSSSQWEAGTVHAQKSIRCSQPAQSLLLAQQHCSTGFEDDIKWRNATRNGPESVPATEASRQVGGSTCWEHANAARNAARVGTSC